MRGRRHFLSPPARCPRRRSPAWPPGRWPGSRPPAARLPVGSPRASACCWRRCWLGGLLGRLLLGWSRRHVRRHRGGARPRPTPTCRASSATGQRELDRVVDARERGGRAARGGAARGVPPRGQVAAERAPGEPRPGRGRRGARDPQPDRGHAAQGRERARRATPSGGRSALAAILGQVARLDGCCGPAGRSSRPSRVPAPVAVGAFLAAVPTLYRRAGDCGGRDARLDAAPPRAARRPRARRPRARQPGAERHPVMPAGGRVTLARAAAWATTSCSGRGHRPRRARPIRATTLFEPFVTGRPEGTGLGLAIVREVAAAHGGTARAVARPGRHHLRAGAAMAAS